MRIAYLDGFSGISGDMFLGALVDAGVPFELLQQTVAALHIGAHVGDVARGPERDFGHQGRCNRERKKDLPREEFWADRDHGKHEPRPTSHDQVHGHVDTARILMAGTSTRFSDHCSRSYQRASQADG